MLHFFSTFQRLHLGICESAFSDPHHSQQLWRTFWNPFRMMAISWLCNGHIMVVFLLAIPWLDHHWFIDVYDSIATYSMGSFLLWGILRQKGTSVPVLELDVTACSKAEVCRTLSDQNGPLSLMIHLFKIVTFHHFPYFLLDFPSQNRDFP